MREREILNPGSRLLLGITEYEIQEVAGQGSNAIVYRAVYKERLKITNGGRKRLIYSDFVDKTGLNGLDDTGRTK